MMDNKIEDEVKRLQNALRHIGHYFESPNSYSKVEIAFIREIIRTEGRCLNNG